MRLLVIDGNSIANRAFFGIKLLTTKDGRYTNAIYGFLNILLSLLKECDPDEVAVALVGEIPGEEVPAAVDAAQACPVSAIRMEES